MNTLSGKSGANNNNTGSPLPLDPATMVPPPVPADAVNQRLALSAALLLSPGKYVVIILSDMLFCCEVDALSGYSSANDLKTLILI